MSMLVDSHCHLDFPDFTEERDAVVGRAREAGIGTMLTIGTRLDQFEGVRAIAEAYDDVWCSVGAHPHEAADHEATTAADLAALAAHPRVVGIGETGLDYYYDHSERERQRTSFRNHIAAARETGLPLIVHTRDAEDHTAAILDEEMAKGRFSGVIHCFTASADFARKALDLGLFISLSGIVTFKNARDLQDTARALPLDRLLIETDSPFLAPVPHRGRPCEPAFVADTARFVASLRDMSVEALAEATSANFHKLFAKTAA